MTDEHVETQLMDGVLALLAGVVDGAGKPVPIYESRVYPSDTRQLPALCVYLPGSTVQQQTRGTPGSRLQRRAVTVKIVGVHAAPMGPQNTLERDMRALGLQVENRLAAGFALQNPKHLRVPLKFTLTRADSGFAGAGTKTVVVGALTFLATIDHREGQAQVALAAQD